MNQGKLDIYKASAGSGKTHTLTHKYISFLTAPDAAPDAYKHILAVTFTNKATEEMKRRIVKGRARKRLPQSGIRPAALSLPYCTTIPTSRSVP